MINFRVEKLFYVRSLFFVHFWIPLTVPISKFFAWTATKFFRGSHKVWILNVCVKWLNIERSKYVRGTIDRYSISRHRNAFGVLICISCYCGNNIVYFQPKPSSPNMDVPKRVGQLRAIKLFTYLAIIRRVNLEISVKVCT